MTYCVAIDGAPFRLEDSMYGDVFNWLIYHDSYFSYMDGLLASGLYGECQKHFFLVALGTHCATFSLYVARIPGLYLVVFLITIGAASVSSTAVPRNIRVVTWAT
jgi:hypothetical protein